MVVMGMGTIFVTMLNGKYVNDPPPITGALKIRERLEKKPDSRLNEVNDVVTGLIVTLLHDFTGTNGFFEITLEKGNLKTLVGLDPPTENPRYFYLIQTDENKAILNTAKIVFHELLETEGFMKVLKRYGAAGLINVYTFTGFGEGRTVFG